MSTHRLPFPSLGAPAFIVLSAVSIHAQSWDTWSAHPGDPRYVHLDYPVAFVATEGHSDPDTETAPHFGLDVISASNPSPHGPGGGLYVLLPDGNVERLFPLAAHEGVPGLIDTPLGMLEKGAVVEPNVSEDGRTLYFAYFHDATWEPNNGGWQSLKTSYKGADLYRLDVGPLLDDPGVDPATLPVMRLTHKDYTGPAKADVYQTSASKLSNATNPALADTPVAYWGTIDMHLIEMRTRAGLQAVWVSNRARLSNSNSWFGDPNHDFNLYIADIRPDGSLGPAHQFQYYTTTSALSPIPLREGLAFSYQSSTEEPRRWDIQAVDSEGRWRPLIGYAHGSELFHLGTLVVDESGEDWFVGLKYYNLNDGGFGNLHKLRLADAGINVFTPGPWGTEPRQLSELLTIGAISQDAPSPRVDVGGQLLYVGKFSSPRAGRVGGEYLMAYTPTSANRWLLDADGNKGVFEAEIVFRPNLEPFAPHEPVDVAQGRGLYRVIADSTDLYDLVWPTPILSWEERTGDDRQRVSAPIADPDTTILPGEPYARVGTSAIYNTDVRPYDCYLGNTGTTPYSPNQISANAHEKLVRAFEGLRYVQDRNDFCRYLQPDAVLGIAVRLTSNRVDTISQASLTYLTDGDSKREATELLGVYSTLDENVADQSFVARIPADTPFEFHLLDRRYGMKLVDVRSWHALQPRETRVDCGGCHQHEAGFAIPFEGTEAASKLPLDMTFETRWVDYDASCRPVIRTSGVPSLPAPEWKADVWPMFDQHCGGCHDATRSSDSAALAAYDYADELSAYQTMKARNYANSTLGALGSPIFWAAYGERTDGRDNDLPQYQPDYPAGVWGYRFSQVHATSPGLCAASNPAWASWVRTLGQWIDDHMGRDADGTAFGYGFDRYHPTVDFAFADPRGNRIRVGFWDDRGSVDLVGQLNGVTVLELFGRPNGSITRPLPPLQPSDRIRVIATDAAGNRQIKDKSVRELYREVQGPRTRTAPSGAPPEAR